uniref:parvalbumin-like EF-hand-containing protein n=1 Tax=Myxine glutinosa TaxID=7769 RepID=UPI00358F7D34
MASSKETNKKEMAAFMKCHGSTISDEELQHVIISGHTGKTSSHVDYNRFLHHISASGKISEKEEELKKAFTKLDKDNSGYIEWNELSYILSDITGEALQRPLSSEEVDNIMELSDTNQDGRLDYNEFKSMMKEALSGSGENK